MIPQNPRVHRKVYQGSEITFVIDPFDFLGVKLFHSYKYNFRWWKKCDEKN